MNIHLPRVSLAHLPTPLEFLPRLSQALGPRLYIKRDDQTGLAGGGNKTRKLEFLAADALEQSADTLITVGAAQSNHCRQTAAAAAKCGLRCLLVLRGDAPPHTSGNLLLDQLLGADVIWSGKREREAVMAEVVASERAAGRRPYPIPLGGSTPLGAAGYALALVELKQQMEAQQLNFDRSLFASSSGGTHAGLAAGAELCDFRGELLGISIDEDLATLRNVVARLATGTAQLLGRPRTFEPSEISANADYLGDGYGVMGEPERQAIELFAQVEGILLDPVYTGRAAAGMIDLIRRGAIKKTETILFWHTGGTPALWAYADELNDK
jgi:D-cysteine desulfhydrase family pyridoxal phosphate-dependent enzyme